MPDVCVLLEVYCCLALGPTCLSVWLAYLGGVRECARVRCVDALGWRDWVGVTEYAS